MANMSNIRPYGPGKFSTILDAYVYDVSLDGGCEDETGDISCGSWYGIMRDGRTIFKDHDPLLESLNEDEQEYLTSCAGVIIREDSDGFVAIDYCDTSDELESKWAEIQAKHETDGDTDE
jgi:hypothetical protein